ncbi:hypothetical protein KY284_032852 [Solanum tuberosum]|nr:hypothetical protein KY284_032852 [Solanum tuberosum]
MTTSLWNPLVSEKKHSACRLKIQKGYDIVQVGWRASNQQCFNTFCPGFVVVITEIPIDTTFSGMSHRGDEASCEETMDITKIGFWPQEIFTNLASFASNVEWGGVVYSPPGVPEPPMGSSYLPIGKTGYDAYCRGLTIINDKGETIDVDRVITHVDNPNLYQIMDVLHLRPGKYQHFVLYGGPGEKAQVQIL